MEVVRENDELFFIFEYVSFTPVSLSLSNPYSTIKTQNRYMDSNLYKCCCCYRTRFRGEKWTSQRLCCSRTFVRIPTHEICHNLYRILAGVRYQRRERSRRELWKSKVHFMCKTCTVLPCRTCGCSQNGTYFVYLISFAGTRK